MSVFVERSLITPAELVDETVQTLQVGDTIAAGDHEALSGAGLAGTIRMTEQPQQLGDGTWRLRVIEEDSPPAAWAPRAVVAHTLSIGIGITLRTETVSVPGAAVGDAVMVALCSAPAAGLLSEVLGAPFGWVSAADTVTVALRLDVVLSSYTVDLAVYVLPPPP